MKEGHAVHSRVVNVATLSKCRRGGDKIAVLDSDVRFAPVHPASKVPRRPQQGEPYEARTSIGGGVNELR